MIDFRYHIVSLIAVFLALGVGIVLGSGPLDERIQGTLQSQTDQLKAQAEDLRSRITDLEKQNQLDDRFAQEVAPVVTRGQLADRTVVIVALPGVGSSLVSGMRDAVKDAGGTVNGTVQLQEYFVQPDKASTMEDVALQSVPAGLSFPNGATPAQRVSVVLARLLMTPQSNGTETSPDTTRLLAALQDLGAIEVDGRPARRSEMAVVLAPPAPDRQPTPPPAASTTAATAPLLTLVDTMDNFSRGAVVAGARLSASSGGFVAAVRAAGSAAGGVSTVDVADTSVGRIATVLAMVEQARGGSGDYGAGSNVDGVLPDVFASP